MRIARVFPTKTHQSPIDADAYFAEPDLFTPHYDEAHVSVVFTWDIIRGQQLAKAWESHANVVKIGGPAMGSRPEGFTPGLYLKPGVTITSRGCVNACPHCFVARREGKLREMPIQPGHILQDNNLLACSRGHVAKVFDMLRGQKNVELSGGLYADAITDAVVDELRSLRIRQMWLAYDSASMFAPLKRAAEKLCKDFDRRKLGCYVLIGFRGDTVEAAQERLLQAWDIGLMPFAMLYRDEQDTPHAPEWGRLRRKWTRPSIIWSRMNHRAQGVQWD